MSIHITIGTKLQKLAHLTGRSHWNGLIVEVRFYTRVGLMKISDEVKPNTDLVVAKTLSKRSQVTQMVKWSSQNGQNACKTNKKVCVTWRR